MLYRHACCEDRGLGARSQGTYSRMPMGQEEHLTPTPRQSSHVDPDNTQAFAMLYIANRQTLTFRGSQAMDAGRCLLSYRRIYNSPLSETNDSLLSLNFLIEG